MNYEVDKLSTENELKKENTLYESKIYETFIDVDSVKISKNNILNEQWDRLKDPVGYWKVLFNRLKEAGIGVKWQVANDPVKSTNMYWGPWVIWKDTNKNGGWPITFSGTDKKVWMFRIPGNKYAGQAVNTINLESKFINSTFNLASWGKVDMKTGTPSLENLFKTKPKSSGAAACKTVDGKTIADNQIPTVAAQIFKDLAYAFDGAGTYESDAVDAYKRITCKKLLDAVNAKVAARGMQGIKTVADWAKDEMSDYDYTQYRQIWAGLQKLGYKAPPVDKAMVAAGIWGKYATPLGFLESLGEGAKKAYDKLMKMSLEDIMEGFREIVSGVAGTIGTLILSLIPGGNLVNMLIYGVLVAWDITQKAQGSQKFSLFNLILDIFSLALSVVGAAKALKPAEAAKPAVAEAKTLPSLFATLESKFPKIYSLLKSFTTTVGKGVNTVLSYMEKGIAWLVQKLPFLSNIGKTLSGAIGKVTGWITSIIEAAGGKAATQIVKTTATQIGKKSAELLAKGTAYLAKAGPILGSKIVVALESKIGSELAKEIDKQIMKKIEAYVGQNATSTIDKLRPGICKMGKKYCDTFDIIMNSATIVKDVTDVINSGKKNIKSTSDISKAKGFLDKTEATINTVKGKVETTQKGVEAYEKDKKISQNIKKEVEDIKKQT